jgi:hypothetical protein
MCALSKSKVSSADLSMICGGTEMNPFWIHNSDNIQEYILEINASYCIEEVKTWLSTK